MVSEDTVIRLEKVGKSYGFELAALHRLKQLFMGDRRGAWAQDGSRRAWALKDINLEVHKGETLGIIGPNGAGKSTLLKILAGVTVPTCGQVDVLGQVFPMIDLNAGLHMDLTGRENVYILGAVMGLSRSEIGERMPQIEAFCELEDYFDQPVRKYSSGMLARLGFAVAVNVDAQILLIDEVLSVGDLAFQHKCLDRMEGLTRSGVSKLFVSHNMRQVDRLCDRAMLLDRGRVMAMGDTTDVVNQYYELSHAKIMEQDDGPAAFEAMGTWEGSGDLVATGVKFLDQNGVEINQVKMFESLTIRLEYFAKSLIKEPIFTMGITTTDMLLVTNFNTANITPRPDVSGHGHIECTLSQVNLLPGVYDIMCIIMGPDGRKYYKAWRLAPFQVTAADYQVLRESAGMVYTPVEWQL